MIYVAECCCSMRKVWRKVYLVMSIGLDAGLWIGGMLGKELFGQLLFILLVSILSSLVLINYSWLRVLKLLVFSNFSDSPQQRYYDVFLRQLPMHTILSVALNSSCPREVPLSQPINSLGTNNSGMLWGSAWSWIYRLDYWSLSPIQSRYGYTKLYIYQEQPKSYFYQFSYYSWEFVHDSPRAQVHNPTQWPWTHRLISSWVAYKLALPMLIVNHYYSIHIS